MHLFLVGGIIEIKGGDNMASMVSLMRKLQRALLVDGKRIKINTFEYYSADKNRMVTCYVLQEDVQIKQKDGTLKNKSNQMGKYYSAVEVVKVLSKLYKGGD